MSDPSGFDSSHYALPVGTNLFEFRIEQVLGHGGFGITYLATDTNLDERVAIKEYMPSEIAVRVSDSRVRAKTRADSENLEHGLNSFLEEARTIARFRHRNIVHVRRFFRLNGTAYIVLEYEHGQTLGQYLEAHKMGNDRLRDLLSSLLDGLDVVHTRATLHRDLKPSNIILRPDESPVLIDFGAARNFESRNSRSVTTIATAGYSPPEQSIGGQQGPWTDLYALGAIAYRIVSGNTPPDSLRRLRKDPLVPASSLDVEYDPTILRTIDWMLKIDESERPISVDAVRNSLGGAVFAAGQNTVGNAASAQQQKSWMLSIDEAKRPSSVDEIRTALQGRAAVPTFAAAAANQEVTAPKSPNVVARPWLTLGAGAVLLLGGASIIGFFGIEYHRHQNGVSQQNTPMQEEAARIQALSRELSAAGQDVQLIQALRRKCGDDCPSELTSEINQRLQQTERSKQQDHVAEKSQAGLDRKAVAAMYFDKLIRANEDVGLLRDFIEECRRDAACGFLSQAEAKYREAELLHRQSEEAKLRLKDIDTQRHNQSGNDAPQQSPSVSLIQNKRESENEFADRTGQSILAIKDRFAATGVLSCPWGNGTAQLTGASNIITTAAHVFYDRTADTCTPRAALGQCVFETETSKGRVSARVGSLVAAGWKCPTLPHHRNDWAVARLERAINTVKPYEVVSISRFIISEGEPLLAVESPSIDYSKGKFIHNCETKGSYLGGPGVTLVETDCDSSAGMAGSTALVVSNAADIVFGILIGNAEITKKPDAGLREGSYREGNYATLLVPLNRDFRKAVLDALK